MKTNVLTGFRIMKSVLSLILLFVMNTWSFSQTKTYVNNQNSQIYGVCLACSVQNPQNAVGSNEGDFSLMQIPLGAIARIEQTLIFPATTKLNKVIIGIGTGQASLSVQLLGGVAIETFNGNVSNNDYKIVNSELLKIGISNPSKGTIEFIATKPYDRVRVTLNSGLLNLNSGLSIYYAYHIPDGCTFPAFDPLHYYPLNGNTNDIISGTHIISTTNPPSFNNMICHQGINASGTSVNSLKANLSPSLKAAYTIAFWVKTEQKQPNMSSPSLTIDAFAMRFRIRNDSIVLGITPPNFGLEPPLEERSSLSTSTAFHHYVLSSENNRTILYKDGSIVTDNSHFNPIMIDLSQMQAITNLIDGSVIISLDRAQIDEFIVYNKTLTDEEIQALYNSYDRPVISQSGLYSDHKILKNIPIKEDFIISPNPTTGQISIYGNILLLDSDIFITNVSGKEVYRSKYKSKTFDLPSTLPGGVYMLTLQTKDKKVYSRKIILRR